MVTMDDAINAYCAWLKRNVSPLHNTAYVRSLETTIRVLEQTPRDCTIIDRLSEQKKTKMKQAHHVGDIDNTRNEITALEWLRMIVNGSEQEWKNWALL